MDSGGLDVDSLWTVLPLFSDDDVDSCGLRWTRCGLDVDFDCPYQLPKCGPAPRLAYIIIYRVWGMSPHQLQPTLYWGPVRPNGDADVHVGTGACCFQLSWAPTSWKTIRYPTDQWGAECVFQDVVWHQTACQTTFSQFGWRF